MKDNSLKQIISRLGRLEMAVYGQRKQQDEKKALKRARGDGLPSHILKLRDQGFFKTHRTAGEVHKKLQSEYQCEPDRVVMALLRLQRRKMLRKSSRVVGRKKQVAYVW